MQSCFYHRRLMPISDGLKEPEQDRERNYPSRVEKFLCLVVRARGRRASSRR